MSKLSTVRCRWGWKRKATSSPPPPLVSKTNDHEKSSMERKGRRREKSEGPNLLLREIINEEKLVKTELFFWKLALLRKRATGCCWVSLTQKYLLFYHLLCCSDGFLAKMSTISVFLRFRKKINSLSRVTMNGFGPRLQTPASPVTRGGSSLCKIPN